MEVAFDESRLSMEENLYRMTNFADKETLMETTRQWTIKDNRQNLTKLD